MRYSVGAGPVRVYGGRRGSGAGTTFLCALFLASCVGWGVTAIGLGLVALPVMVVTLVAIIAFKAVPWFKSLGH